MTWKVIFFSRIVKVADIVSVLQSNTHNGFPVSDYDTVCLHFS